MMSKKRGIILLILVLALSLSLTCIGCSKSADQNKSKSQAQNKPLQTSQSKKKTFTKTELSKYNGLNGNKAYVAVDGIVYDITNVGVWNKGQHQSHKAGTDLTAVMKDAPHGKRILKGMPVAGKLSD